MLDGWGDPVASSSPAAPLDEQENRGGFTNQRTWESRGFQKAKTVVLSECRDLVLVPTGDDYRIRELTESHPQFCWRFSGASSLAQFHFDMAERWLSDDGYPIDPKETGAGQDLPVFYAHLPHAFSPYEFSVMPKQFVPVQRRLEEAMQAVYERGEVNELGKDQMVSGMACAVCVEGRWLRARVIRPCGLTSVLATMVDLGTDAILDRGSFRPLLKRFGRAPPLALACRIRDVFINDLEQKRIEEFQRLVDSFGRNVRVQLTTTTEPYLVNVLHPTVAGQNVGALFYRPVSDGQREAAKAKKWAAWRQRNADGFLNRGYGGDEVVEKKKGEQTEEEEEEEEEWDCEYEPPPQFIYSLERSDKATRVVDGKFRVGFVENARLVYAHAEWQLRLRHKMEMEMKEEWSTFPLLPSEWVEPGVACALRFDLRSVEGVIEGGEGEGQGDGQTAIEEDGVYRAVMEEMVIGEGETGEGGQRVRVLLADHGCSVQATVDALRAIPDKFNEPPLLYVVGLSQSGEYHPHPTETRLLRQVLSECGGVVRFVADRRHKRIPMRGRLIGEGCETGEWMGGDVEEEVKQRMDMLRVSHPCTAVAPYVPRLFSPRPLINFRHVLHCPMALLKGKLEYASLPEQSC